MDSQIYGLLFILLFTSSASALSSNPHHHTAAPKQQHSSSSSTNSSTPPPINSNSVLVALLDSHYTELAELVEKALLLHTLESAVTRHNITIFAPKNEALERDLDPEFKRFLLEPGNIKSLQSLLLFHVIPTRLASHQLQIPTPHRTLHRDEHLNLNNLPNVVRPDDVVRPDGVIHGIESLLIPRSVQQDFNNRRNLRSISAVKPESAPVVDPRTHRLKKPAAPAPAGSPPALPIYDAMAPGPSLAPAPAPGPGGPHGHFDGEKQIKDFIQTLLLYGGYNELADILVNLTSLATEMGRLVSEGYVLTVLAPNDDAMGKLTTDQLSEPGAPEQIMYYHMIPEYLTEESMYNAVRRFGKVTYDTLRVPMKVVAEEADGSVKFGEGDNAAYLYDPDIFMDGRISVQGVDAVLFPVGESSAATVTKATPLAAKPVNNSHRRGKLMEVTCGVLRAFGQDSRLNTCQ